LTVFTNLVVAQTNEPPPPPGKPTIPTDATHFKVFTNGGFVTGIGLNPSKSTIVLTHGWKDSSSNWPLEMANLIKLELGSSTPNIVAWDWTAEAAQPLPTATLDTQGQGYGLGENLTNALGANYSQRIHFIGHSLGTLVNAKAANFIHTNGFSWSNTQMTLFDEAEVAWGMVGNSWATLTSLLENDSSPQQDWKHPLPDHCAWADNYITAFGMPHPQAVNVILTNLAPDLSNIQNLFDFGIGAWTGQFQTEITDYHNYSYIWYNNTVSQINNPNDPPYPMGFVRSWEGGGYSARPSANTYYIESTICPPSFPSYSGYDPAYNLVQINSDQANQYLNARPQNLISQVGVNLVSSSANILANNNNQVQVQLLDGPAVSASSQITGPAYALATLIKLFTTSLINGNGPIRPKGGSPTNSPAYVWIPVTVPSNALAMAFNFMLQGNGNQDSFQVALNSNNLMTVETVLIQTNVTMSSGMLDVSQYAGQQAELFFGIVGGTSTNAIGTVSDIAFYVTLPPSLQIQLAGTNVVLTWPLSGAGYVLQSANQFTPPTAWTTVTNEPVVVNFQYTVTNQISGGKRFYRLAKTSMVAPALHAQISGSSFVLSWPASEQNVSLQTTTNLTDANSWTTVTNVPALLNQQNVVTNGMSDRMRFYRLKMQ
jgi:pimeloyl-ACP methyl ester carboxylesterase